MGKDPPPERKRFGLAMSKSQGDSLCYFRGSLPLRASLEAHIPLGPVCAAPLPQIFHILQSSEFSHAARSIQVCRLAGDMALFLGCLPVIYKFLSCIPSPYTLGEVVYSCNPNPGEVEVGGANVQDDLATEWVHGILGYTGPLPTKFADTVVLNFLSAFLKGGVKKPQCAAGCPTFPQASESYYSAK